jgi:hypothetical protein
MIKPSIFTLKVSGTAVPYVLELQTNLNSKNIMVCKFVECEKNLLKERYGLVTTISNTLIDLAEITKETYVDMILTRKEETISV